MAPAEDNSGNWKNDPNLNPYLINDRKWTHEVRQNLQKWQREHPGRFESKSKPGSSYTRLKYYLADEEFPTQLPLTRAVGGNYPVLSNIFDVERDEIKEGFCVTISSAEDLDRIQELAGDIIVDTVIASARRENYMAAIRASSS